MSEMNRALDLGKLVDPSYVAHGFRTTGKMTRIGIDTGDLMIPIIEVTFQRGNGSVVPVLIPPDLIVPLSHALLGVLAQQGATPPAPPTAPGPTAATPSPRP